AELARVNRRFDEVHHGIFKAFFEDGLDIDDLDTLVMIGTAAGLNGEAVHGALNQGTYRERVIEDERLAVDLGITAVPTMMVGTTDGLPQQAQVISGAQPYEAVKAAIERATRPR
ncbi:MAG TPA: DsbA family protein, partial [Nitrospiraceae bacterium]|nr:DsbA family protein [Nitrospiraceae bacterium]